VRAAMIAAGGKVRRIARAGARPTAGSWQDLQRDSKRDSPILWLCAAAGPWIIAATARPAHNPSRHRIHASQDIFSSGNILGAVQESVNGTLGCVGWPKRGYK